MRKIITTLSAVLCLTQAFSAPLQNPPIKDFRTTLLDSLNRELQQARTTKDSLAIFYDLYDLSLKKERQQWAWKVYDLNRRIGDTENQCDMLCQLSVLYMLEDSVLQRIEQLAGSMPESQRQKETLLFVRLQQVTSQAKSLNGKLQQEELMKIFSNEDKEHTDDLYDNIQQLYSLCIYLSYTTSGKLYTEYLQRLEELIRRLPGDSYSLRNLFYTRAAIVYTSNGVHNKAIAADREMLRIIAELERKYAAMGRRFRNYDANYYICYRRMLSNFPGLTEQETKELYNKSVALSKKNKDIFLDLESSPRITVFYLMKQRKYAQAIPYIKKVLASENRDLSPAHKRQMLALLKEAATATGDDASLLMALKEYNDMLLKYQQDSYDELYRELQIRYEVNNLKAENVQLELEKRTNEARSNRKIILIYMIFLILALVMVGVVYYFYYRARTLANRLLRMNETLKQGREELINIQKELILSCEQAEKANHAKSEFLHSMSHEVRTPLNAIMGFSQLLVKKIPEDYRGKLEQFSRLITLNTEYLSTLISDILDVSSLESGEMLCESAPVHIHTIATVAVDNMRERAKSGVTMEFVPTTPDFLISTDRLRVEQVLLNLLSNAAKFTEEGSIVLSYRVDETRHLLVFTVMDTGRGIPDGKEEVIFDRFVKLDPFVQGSGLGLYLSRYIARLLGGDLYVDRLYDKGACFHFSIPIK